MTITYESAKIAIVLAVLLVSILVWFQNWTARKKLRLEQLAIAAEAMSRFAAAKDAFVRDAGAPGNLKQVLEQLNGYLDDREFAVFMASDPEKSARSDGPLLQELEKLATHRKDLVETFHTAAISGTIATILWHQESAAMFERVIALMAMDPRKDDGFMSRALKWISPPHQGVGNGGTAGACA